MCIKIFRMLLENQYQLTADWEYMHFTNIADIINRDYQVKQILNVFLKQSPPNDIKFEKRGGV